MSNKLMAAGLLLALNTMAWAGTAPAAAPPVAPVLPTAPSAQPAAATSVPPAATIAAPKESPTKSGSMSSPTFGQIAELNAQWQYQEVLNKLNESRSKGSPSAKSATGDSQVAASAGTLPKPVVSSTALPLPPLSLVSGREEVHVTAVYGMGEDLYADVKYGDLSTTVSVNDNSRLGPWRVIKLTPDELTLRQETVVGKGKKRKVTTSTKVVLISALSSPSSDALGAGRTHSDLPALPPAKSSPTSMTSMPAIPIALPPPPSMKD